MSEDKTDLGIPVHLGSLLLTVHFVLERLTDINGAIKAKDGENDLDEDIASLQRVQSRAQGTFSFMMKNSGVGNESVKSILETSKDLLARSFANMEISTDVDFKH